ncbi:MAG: ABC transporter ATP-binding protein [Phycisphaerales bacterium]|nr:ABC transporter ATP-binding protein [Phycisphaerales bacterium]
MLRQPGLLGLALLFAAFSAGGLGAGLLGIKPILDNVLGQHRNLADMANQANMDGALPFRVPVWAIKLLPGDRFDTVLWLMIGLGFLTSLGAVANFMHSYFSLTVVSRTVADVRREAFRHVVQLPLKTVLASGQPGGLPGVPAVSTGAYTGGATDAISRIVYDSATLGSGLSALLSRGVAQTTKGAAALITAFVLDWRLAMIALTVAPVLAAVIRKLGKRIKRASRSALEGQASMYRASSEALAGLRVVKVSTTENAEVARFRRINDQVVRQELRARTARALASPLVETLSLIVIGTLVMIAAKQIIKGDLLAGDFLLVLGALGFAGAQLKPLTGILNDIQQASAAADRLGQLLGLAREPGHERGLPRLARHSRSIEFRNVTFTYPGAHAPSIQNVSLTIPHGQAVAFVGPNGSGKTTLLSLVPRLFDPDSSAPSDGVFIDGQDIRRFGVRSVRRQMGVVTQETVLFHGPIGANISYGTPLATEAQVREAARRARAEEFILARPSGYGTVLGESGAGLSGGQRQRLAIARAILRDPAILILDEATSMIDADSESKIAEALADFSRGRTCLVVAHRLSTVMNADRIIVMDEGRIVDDGRHDELLARCEVYRMIARSQLFRREAGDDGMSSAPAA